MEEYLECILCGGLISVAVAGTLYCFTEKYCIDCKKKLEGQKHIVENTMPADTRQIYVAGVSGTTVVINTSNNYFDSEGFWRNIKIN